MGSAKYSAAKVLLDNGADLFAENRQKAFPFDKATHAYKCNLKFMPEQTYNEIEKLLKRKKIY